MNQPLQTAAPLFCQYNIKQCLKLKTLNLHNSYLALPFNCTPTLSKFYMQRPAKKILNATGQNFHSQMNTLYRFFETKCPIFSRYLRTMQQEKCSV